LGGRAQEDFRGAFGLMAFESQYRYLTQPFIHRRGQIGGVGQTMISFDASFFEAIENFIQQTRRMQRGVPVAMRRLALFGAATQLAEAQKRSLGPLDPQQRLDSAAWQVPVRRISGRYFFGWKVRRVGPTAYAMYNDSREAYFIEFGIHTSNRRIRRPILKLSLKYAVEFLRTTAVGHRIWAELAMPPPGKRVGKGFIWRMQSPITESVAIPGIFGKSTSVLGEDILGRIAP
jgi:hypothetical protein